MKKPSIQLRSLVEAQDAPAVVIDKHYRIIAANDAYCASYGVAPKQVIGRCCHEISHRSPVPCHLNGESCPHHEVFTTDKPFEVLHTHFDKHNRPDHVRIKAYPLHDERGDTYLLEAIHRLAPALDLSCEEMRMVGRSPAFLACIENLTIAARSEAPVLIYGETGAGKELAAQFIHHQSRRQGETFVELNCAAIPEALCESELFGHERGAFTGCAGLKRGLFELAHGGTLFLDEISEMPLPMQAKLLRVLDSGKFRRVGGEQLLASDARVIAATNRNLMALVEEGRFREDLYFRVAGIKINVPPLRERRADIPALAETLVKRLTQPGEEPARLSKDAVEWLVRYDYPGNVRELRNILERAIAHSEDGIIGQRHLVAPDQDFYRRAAGSGDKAAGEAARSAPSRAGGTSMSLAEMETQQINSLMHKHGGNRRMVATALGISERTLYRKLSKSLAD